MNELAKKISHMRAEGTLPIAELNAKVSLALLFCDPGMTAWARREGLREVTSRLLTHEECKTIEPIDFKRWVSTIPGGVKTVAEAVYSVLNERIPDEEPDELLEIMALRFTQHLSAITQVL